MHVAARCGHTNVTVALLGRGSQAHPVSDDIYLYLYKCSLSNVGPCVPRSRSSLTFLGRVPRSRSSVALGNTAIYCICAICTTWRSKMMLERLCGAAWRSKMLLERYCRATWRSKMLLERPSGAPWRSKTLLKRRCEATWSSKMQLQVVSKPLNARKHHSSLFRRHFAFENAFAITARSHCSKSLARAPLHSPQPYSAQP